MALDTTAVDAAVVRRLLAGLRPHAGALVDASGIPERRLAAGAGRKPAA